MIAKRWLTPLGYAVATVFVAWHTLALIVPPGPDSVLKKALMRPLDTYLTWFRLNNFWGFFSPNVGDGQVLRYVVEDQTGALHSFMPTQGFSFLDPRYLWTISWNNAIISSPEDHVDRAGGLFCKRHAALRPVSVTLIHVEQKGFSPEDQLAGRSPLAPPFVRETVLGQVTCSDT